MRIEGGALGEVWSELVSKLYSRPAFEVAPRGQAVFELTNVNLVIRDARSNVFENPGRDLNYRFGVAEWLWIWFGRNDVASIARYNRHIADFSDDGQTFDGAYGPMIKPQWRQTVNKLRSDRDSRQAILQIYRPPQRETKDVPCTLSIQFLLRNDYLNTLATMRSSDVWLGLPYDAFTFSMLGNIMAGLLGVEQGWLAFNLGSSHLYERNLTEACRALGKSTHSYMSPVLPGEPPAWLEHVLVDQASLGMNDRVWGRYAQVLLSKTRGEALELLK